MKKIILSLLFLFSIKAFATVTSVSPKNWLTSSNTNYSTSNVGTGSKVQIVQALSKPVTLVDVFDSSGQTLLLISTLNATDTDVFTIYPGGNGQIPVFIPQGAAVSLKAVSATANSGSSIINFFN